MMVDHAFRIAGGARGVVQADRLPFVRRQLPGVILVAAGKECFVIDGADRFAGAAVERVVDIHHQRLAAGECERLLDHRRKFAVHDHRLGFAVVEHECDGFGIEPGVERIEDGAAHRHAEVGFHHRRRVGQHDGHGVAKADARLRERRGELTAAVVGMRPGAADVAVNDGEPVGIDRGGAFDEAERGERDVIGFVAIEAGVVNAGHGNLQVQCRTG